MQTQERILLAESSADDALLLCVAFREVGVENPVDVVSSEDQAKTYLKRETPSPANNSLPILIVLALRLQLFKDFSLLRWIRAQPTLREIPVFVFSGVAIEDEDRRAHELGSDSYAKKPGSFKDLTKIAERLRDRWITKG